MLNTVLRTSQQRILGTAILQWDTLSLYIYYVFQFYREALAEPISHNNSFIILGHPCIFWNHLESWHIFGNLWILLGYIGDLLEIYYQDFISYHQLYSANMYNFDISISHKSSFFLFTNYKSDIFHFASFFRCISPLCLPFLSPRCVSPVCLTVFGSKSSSQSFRLSAKKEQTDGNR